MAEQKKPYDDGDLNEDELIKNLVPDPSQVPDARMLFGFLGKSSREGYRRLYLTPELNEYVEFQEEDVLHTLSFATPENPLGGKVVWVKREANLFHTRTASREAQADFLRGDISTAFLRGAGVGAISGLRALIAFGLAASGSGLCTLDSKCITSVDTDPFCPKVTLPISTSTCACLAV